MKIQFTRTRHIPPMDQKQIPKQLMCVEQTGGKQTPDGLFAKSL